MVWGLHRHTHTFPQFPMETFPIPEDGEGAEFMSHWCFWSCCRSVRFSVTWDHECHFPVTAILLPTSCCVPHLCTIFPRVTEATLLSAGPPRTPWPFRSHPSALCSWFPGLGTGNHVKPCFSTWDRKVPWRSTAVCQGHLATLDKQDASS